MGFEKFTKTRARGYVPKASIWSRGQIGFNKGAAEKYNLNNFLYAILFYDKDNKQIGIKFTNDENEEGEIKITRRPAGGMSISAKAFLDFYGIEHQKTTKCNMHYDKENDLYVLKEIKNTK